MMTVHVLHAGDGYTYLTRQVATGDQHAHSATQLTDYYTAEGNPPGMWFGSGRDALGVSGEVTESQMKALFGEGLHPDAERIINDAIASGTPAKDAIAAARLGRPFPRFALVDDGWNKAIRSAYASFEGDHGRLPEAGPERDLVRWNVARIRAEKSLERVPTDAEVASHLAGVGKQDRQAVAGYDLVFAPVKSVSVLWGVADDHTSQLVEEAHRAAWQKALLWLEGEACITRVGTAGVAQVEANGFVVAAFDHRDSRTGDPQLHTHVTVSNKVQAADGKWRALDARVLHSLGVAASERYNSQLEEELRNRLDVTFVGADRGDGKQQVRELAGVPEALIEEFSGRRRLIQPTLDRLIEEYTARHGHTPPRAVQYRLAQQATLDTRTQKEGLKKLSEQRKEWQTTASSIIGERRLNRISDAITQRAVLSDRETQLRTMNLDELAELVLAEVETARSVWRYNHVRAAAERVSREWVQLNPSHRTADIAADIAKRSVARCISLEAPEINAVPGGLRNGYGRSVYLMRRGEQFTSSRIDALERGLLRASEQTGGFCVDKDVVDQSVTAVNSVSGFDLSESQVELARLFASGGHGIEVGIGPAGSGKTSAMRAFAHATQSAGGRVLGFTLSSNAATVLQREIELPTDTVAKFLDVHRSGTQAQRDSHEYRIDARTLVLVDEAGMISTPDLAELVEVVTRGGGGVRLLGDPQQLQAIGAGGALRMLEKRTNAVTLQELHRFTTPGEAEATLLFRDGNPEALSFYEKEQRLHGGSRVAMLEELYTAWAGDIAAGRSSLMIAGTSADVAALNDRAHQARVAAGSVSGASVQLRDDTSAQVGDTVVTRLNSRTLRTQTGNDYVRNGSLWTVIEVHEFGDITVEAFGHRGRVKLPAAYVAENVQLGYATTTNRAQGTTVDVARQFIDPRSTTRESASVGSTRGRLSNAFYVAVDDVVGADGHTPDAIPGSVRQKMLAVLAREGAALSAHDVREQNIVDARTLSVLLPPYQDVANRVLGGDRIQPIKDAVLRVMPGYADQVLGDEAAWPALAERLLEHSRAGADIDELLEDSARQKPPAGVSSMARLVHWRVGVPDTPQVIPDRGMPTWASPVPAPSMTVAQTTPVVSWSERVDESATRDWMRAQADLIRARVDVLVDEAIVGRPAWMMNAGIVTPEDAHENSSWRQHLANVVAYRDLAKVVDPESALGDPAGTKEYAVARVSLHVIMDPALVEQQSATVPQLTDQQQRPFGTVRQIPEQLAALENELRGRRELLQERYAHLQAEKARLKSPQPSGIAPEVDMTTAESNLRAEFQAYRDDLGIYESKATQHQQLAQETRFRDRLSQKRSAEEERRRIYLERLADQRRRERQYAGTDAAQPQTQRQQGPVL